MARFTAANSRDMAALSAIARKNRKLAKNVVAALPQANETEAGNFVEQSLARARVQITLLSNRLTAELQNPKADPMSIDRLTRSLATLVEDERKLSGRSLPPTVKAAAAKRAPQRPLFTEPS